MHTICKTLLILALTTTYSSNALAQSTPPNFLVEFEGQFNAAAEKLVALAKAMPQLAPAASQGTMNNLIIGGIDQRHNRPFTYYETIAGGSGAGPVGPGADGIQVAMTNTLNTPIEAMEIAYCLLYTSPSPRD